MKYIITLILLFFLGFLGSTIFYRDDNNVIVKVEKAAELRQKKLNQALDY